MKYKYIFFDLDGTLTNSGEGIIKSLEYAFRELNLKVPPKSTLQKFIGPPLWQSFHELMHFDDDTAAAAIKKYRERYLVKGIYENSPYDGIEEALQAALDAGKILAVATSKPEHMTLTVMKHFDLGKYFRVVAGAESEDDSKADVIEKACQRLGLSEEDKAQVLMVGDRKYDIIGAHKCGIKCCGVGYGFAQPGELAEFGADYTTETVEELKELLCRI